jgi:hypothetical protein
MGYCKVFLWDHESKLLVELLRKFLHCTLLMKLISWGKKMKVNMPTRNSYVSVMHSYFLSWICNLMLKTSPFDVGIWPRLVLAWRCCWWLWLPAVDTRAWLCGWLFFFFFRSSDFYLFIASLLGFCFDVSKMRVRPYSLDSWSIKYRWSSRLTHNSIDSVKPK